MVKGAGIHIYALTLSALLFAVFAAATALYAHYGRAVVLRVFEENQLQRAATSRDMMSVLHLADYVRVDPSSVEMRGRLVDALIQNNRVPQALEIAFAGLQQTPADDLPLAQLVFVRAAIAAGDANRAGEIIDSLTQQPQVSAEAWYLAASLSAANGDFTRMRDAFDRLARPDTAGSTQQFIEQRNAAQRTIEALDSSSVSNPALPSAAPRARSLLITGRLDDALELISAPEMTHDDPLLVFWRGVHEDLQGRPEAAQSLYKSAAARGDSLAKLALNRR